MTRLVSLSFGVALAILAMLGTVQAQAVNQVHGTIQAADCSANTLRRNAPDGVHTFTVSSATAVYVDSAASSFCALSHSIGSPATVWSTANGDQVLAGRLDVTQRPEASVPKASGQSNSGPSNSGTSNNGPYNYGPYYAPYYYGCTPFPSLYYGGPYAPYVPYFGGCGGDRR
jgi:hypothetical protein